MLKDATVESSQQNTLFHTKNHHLLKTQMLRSLVMNGSRDAASSQLKFNPSLLIATLLSICPPIPA